MGPHTLIEENRKERARICKENLEKFNEGKWRWCDVITGDESWFYHRHIGKQAVKCKLNCRRSTTTIHRKKRTLRA